MGEYPDGGYGHYSRQALSWDAEPNPTSDATTFRNMPIDTFAPVDVSYIAIYGVMRKRHWLLALYAVAFTAFVTGYLFAAVCLGTLPFYVGLFTAVALALLVWSGWKLAQYDDNKREEADDD